LFIHSVSSGGERSALPKTVQQGLFIRSQAVPSVACLRLSVRSQAAANAARYPRPGERKAQKKNNYNVKEKQSQHCYQKAIRAVLHSFPDGGER